MLPINGSDGYKNKTMEYITEEMRNYIPKESDIYLALPDGRKGRFMCSEPLELEEHEIKLWNDFLQWIQDKKLEPLPKEYTDYTRIGLKYLLGNIDCSLHLRVSQHGHDSESLPAPLP